jgi:hypothetical protein
MSPSEFDLRAALHDGEGGELNVDQLILHARAHAAQRRARMMSAAAVIAVVTGVGVGIAVTDGAGSSGNSDSAAGGAARSSAERPHGALYGQGKSAPPARAGSGADESAHAAGQAAPPCPASLPRYGSANGSDARLFRTTVSSVVVCAYGTRSTQAAGSGKPVRLAFHDGAAKRLAASLEEAPTLPSTASCTALHNAQVHDFLIIGLDVNGGSAGTVSASLPNSPCAPAATNGRAVRYGWSPPADVRRRLIAAHPAE